LTRELPSWGSRGPLISAPSLAQILPSVGLSRSRRTPIKARSVPLAVRLICQRTSRTLPYGRWYRLCVAVGAKRRPNDERDRLHVLGNPQSISRTQLLHLLQHRGHTRITRLLTKTLQRICTSKEPMKVRTLIPLAAVVLVTACTTTRFLPYTGAQSDWPTAAGALAEERDGMPVYHGLPPKPYDILGRLELERLNRLAPNTLTKAVSEARKRGGDAVMVVEEGSRFLAYQHRATASQYGRTTTAYGSSNPQYSETATVFLIRFRQ
jgi:hypothetical protein